MIRVRGLHKAFGESGRAIPVLRGVDLEAGRGEFVALTGRSGSGKSTLLNLIAGLEVPDRGSISIEGTELTALDDSRRTIFRRDRIGIVFQFFNLLPVLSALDNVALPGLLAGRPRRAVEARARALLESMGLGARVDAFPEELSGGEQQRVATARALVNDPVLILADEPTGNLDSASSDGTLDLLERLARLDGRTVLMVTHDPAAAARAGRSLTLVDGRVAQTALEAGEDRPLEKSGSDAAGVPG
ncbi:MAG: ABC transporter ATP-binding protein [Gemmatimonadetes bacterium]|nr:ABC transporter ATP-binding protein [Gemmatimonadota bacterium]